MRAGLAALFAQHPGYAVAGTSSPGVDADALWADVILWDAGPSQNLGADLAALAGMEVPVVALLDDADQGPAAWAAGAQALLPRDVPLEALATTLMAVVQGLTVLDAGIVQAVRPWPEAPEAAEALTPREAEVLALVAEGLPNKLIADRLGISENTVKFHVAALLGKLGAASRTEAVVRAARLGLLIL